MRRMFMFCLATVTFMAACTPLVNAPQTAAPMTDKLAEIQARGTLVIATDADYPPQSRLLFNTTPSSDTKCASTQYTSNQMDGFDVAVAIELADRLGVEPCFVTPPWSQLIAGNWGDNWDVHIGSVAITFDRMQVLYFSQPYYATPSVALVHKNNTTYQKLEDLSGKRIGVCVGCTFEAYLKGDLQMPNQDIQYRIQNAVVVGYENEAPAIADLSLGDGVKLDAVLAILPLARRAIASGRPLRILEPPLLFAYASITLDRSARRDQARLLEVISRSINEMHQEGILKQYSIAYQGLDLTQEAARFDISKLKQATTP